MGARARSAAQVAASLLLITGSFLYLSSASFPPELDFFLTPSELLGANPPAGACRVAGIIVPGTVLSREGGLETRFELVEAADLPERRMKEGPKIRVRYLGVERSRIIPGTAAIVEGTLHGGEFEATELITGCGKYEADSLRTDGY